MTTMDMPQMTPLPIRTKGESFLVRVWRWMTDIRQWRVVEDWEYMLPDGTRVVIPENFVFDGASIPQCLWGMLSPTGLLLIPGLIHDFGYRYDYIWALDADDYVYKYQVGAGQEYWDEVFRQVGMDINGMPLIDTIAWTSLAIAGRSAWYSNRKRNEAELRPNKPMRPAQ